MRDDFGAQLREHRVAKGLSLRAVAAAVGISASMLSQVETGKLHPSVSTLYDIAAFLGISLDDLLGTDGYGESAAQSVASAPPSVQRSAENPRIELEGGVTWEQLSRMPHSLVDPLLVTYGPGASSSASGKMMRHAGVEHGYLVEGELTLRLDFDAVALEPGDSFSFDARRPHLFVNERDVPAKGVWFTARSLEEVESALSGRDATVQTAAERAVKALREGI